MEIMSYTAVRNNLAHVLDKVSDDHVPVVVTRQNGRKAVLLGYDDYMSFLETAHLLANPYNAERIHQGIAEVEAGLTQEHALIEA